MAFGIEGIAMRIRSTLAGIIILLAAGAGLALAQEGEGLSEVLSDLLRGTHHGMDEALAE